MKMLTTWSGIKKEKDESILTLAAHATIVRNFLKLDKV